MRRWLIAFACLFSGAAAAGDFSVSVDAAPLSFSALSPQEGERLVPEATRVHVVSTDARWTLRVRAAGPLRSSVQTDRTLPIDRLRFRMSGQGAPAEMTMDEHALLVDQPPTGPSGRVVTLDYGLRAKWGDPATRAGETFTTELQYTLSPAEGSAPFASPSPFSPDADGVRDQTELRFTEIGATEVRVLDAADRVVHRLVVPSAEGPERRVPWDGRSADGAYVAEGSYRLRLMRGSDVLAEVPVEVALNARRGTAVVNALVESSEGGSLADVELTLRTVAGVVQGRARTDSLGRATFTEVPAGIFFIEALRPLYLPAQGALFEVVDAAQVSHSVRLVHNHSLTIGLTSSVPRAVPGERIAFEATVRAVGTTPVDDVSLALGWPSGLVVDPASLHVDGARVDSDLNTVLLGRMEIGTTRHVRFAASLSPGAARQRVTAVASGTAMGEPARTREAVVSVGAIGGELGGRGGIFGRVCWDLDGDRHCGPDEPPARGAVVFLEDSSYSQADRLGRFHFGPLLPGRHALLAGPGPLELPQRSGALPRLPRTGTTRAVARVFAGQYVPLDLPLPVPPGMAGDRSLFEELEPDLDGGEVTTPIRERRTLAAGELNEEGALDDSGRLMDLRAPAPPPTPGKLVPFDAAKDPLAPFAETPPSAAAPARAAEPTVASSAFLGAGEAQLGLAPSADGERFDTFFDGRAAFTFQHDFTDRSRATLVVDTARNGREDTLAALDPRGGYVDWGDDARTRMNDQEKLYVRLDLPWMYLQGGRMGAGLTDTELLRFERSYVGGVVGFEGPAASARLFGGFSGDPQQKDELPGNDSVGPYALSSSPVVVGSELVDLELRDSGGEVIQRTRLVRGADYFIDFERGQLELSRPVPSTGPGGTTSVLVVRYQVLSNEPLLSGWLMGARAHVGHRGRRLGLTALWQSTPDRPSVGVTADASLSAGPLRFEGEAGMRPLEPGDRLAASAGRGRLTLDLGPVELFGFGLAQGAQWADTLRSRALELPISSPFPLLDSSGTTPLGVPVLALALADDRPFPYFLGDAADRVEAGAGLRATAGPVRAVTLTRRGWTIGDPESARDQAELAARARVGPVTVYGGNVTRSAAGELLGPSTADRTQQSFVGALAQGAGFAAELDYRHARSELAVGTEELEQELALRLRMDRVAAFMPSVLLSQLTVDGEERFGLLRQAAVGVESKPLRSLRLFAYLSQRIADGEGLTAGPAAFAGLQWHGNEGNQLLARYDLQRAASGSDYQHRLSWDARARPINALTFGSDGAWTFGGTEHFARLSAAWVPTGPVRVLARAQQEQTSGVEGVTQLRIGSLDVGVLASRQLRVDGKALVRTDSLDGAEPGLAALAGLAVTTHLGAGWDVGAGGRLLADNAGAHPGGFAEVGFTLADMFRVGAGVNLSGRAEVFTIDRQRPGVFVNLTGTYGGSFGGPAVKEEWANETAPTTAVAAAAPSKTPGPSATGERGAAAPTAAAVVAKREASGRVFVDRNGNGKFDADERALAGTKLTAGGREVVTDANGQFSLGELAAGAVSVQLVDRGDFLFAPSLPSPHVPDRGGAHVVDLAIPAQKAPALSDTELSLQLAAGRATATAIANVTFPLAAWVAGLPLSPQEASRLEAIASRVHDSPDYRLVVVAHQQTIGAPAKAAKRAADGARAIRRYLQATQMVPGKRILTSVVEAPPGVQDPLGHVDLWLVKVAPGAK